MPRVVLPVLLLVSLATAGLAWRPQVPAKPAPSTASADAIRLNNLGVATMNQQKFEAALPYFEKAAAAAPGFAVARVNQAIALINLQKYDAAREILTAAADADPGNARALYNLGLLTKSTGEAEASLAAFERVVTLRPADPHSHYFVGLMAAQLGNYDKAIAAFSRALEIDRFLVSAEFGLARALQRAGRSEESKMHIERFQRLTTEKVATAMSLAYGDQGPLSLAEAVLPEGGASAAPIEVTFKAVEPPPAAASMTGAVGPGGCALDVDGDGALDYLRLGREGASLLKNTGKGGFAEPVSIAQLPLASACAIGDFDNDEHADLALGTEDGSIALYRNTGSGAFTDVTTAARLTSARGFLLGLAFVDFDHDGDLDLFVPRTAAVGPGGPAPPSARTVWRNNGNGTFEDVTKARGFDAPGRTAAVTASDLDNDRAIDLVFTGEPTSVYFNPREGAFKPVQPWKGEMPGATLGVSILDFNKDGWMDLAFTHAGAPGVSLWQNEAGRSFSRVALPDAGLTIATGVSTVDYDNDGWLDLVVTGSRGGQSGVLVFRNEGGRYADRTAAVALDTLAIPNARAIVPFDVDGDRDSDLVVTSAPGAMTVLRNDGGNANRAISLTLKGLNDNRSGIGTKVEVQAGPIWQKFEALSGAGFLGQGAPVILAGIGREPQADVVRLLWPTGVVQDEVQISADKPAVIEQVDRRGSSCPVIFTWNGREYEFITDAIGPAVIGHWVAPGQRNVPDPNEYVKVEGRQLVARGGRLSIKFMEPMEEVIYLDQARLIAIDHPDGTDIYPNEYFAATAPQPADRVFGVRDARPPLGAWDQAGRDVLPLLRDRDRRYVASLESGGFKGFAAPHFVELDLGDVRAGAPLRLIMAGFTDYFTATSVFAAHQAEVTAVVPYLDALLPDGRWQRVADDIGFPAGLRRTMTADLTGKLPAGARRVRIGTNLKVYWDQILLDSTPEGAVAMRRTDVPLVSASLAFRGFPRETTGTPAADLSYVYDQVSRFGPWARHRGHYTRYGDVTPLVTGVEDRFVIFGAGEEVGLEFDATALPPLPEGWTRDYLVYLHGYVKDMDFYAAHAQTVTPLPFAAMESYPYRAGVQYPDSNAGYLLEWNTRAVEREAWPSYRADYRLRR